ncbi:helix-turn-helix domain-containing protein [Vibrio parahaemolyticus]|uniref:helix-turn-helix domain-containing protein n=1 Tax=Vibrio parahaemolyticus TaxID=670 RepID=UPI0022EAA78F|nr:helix-turn-helix domain-containing protein [Vibrio parahaemolyticus]
MRNQFAITKEIIEANLKQLHNVSPIEKLVLIVLSSYLGDKDGNGVFSCYPSQARLARDAGCSRPTVNSALQKFEELSFISSAFRATTDGGNTSKLYTWKGIPQTNQQEDVVTDVDVEYESAFSTTETSELDHSIEVSAQIPPTRQSDWWDELEATLEPQPPF